MLHAKAGVDKSEKKLRKGFPIRESFPKLWARSRPLSLEVLELGAGCGVAGLAAAAVGAREVCIFLVCKKCTRLADPSSFLSSNLRARHVDVEGIFHTVLQAVFRPSLSFDV